MKVKINLRNKKDGELITIYNEVFNQQNGIAFFELERDKWEVLSYHQQVVTVKNGEYYEGDKVLVKGTKTIGLYETYIIRTLQGWTLKENKTYLNDDKCFIAIQEKV